MAARERWYLYLVECRDGTLYAGVARDVARRIAAHNTGRGARYVRGRGPVTLVAATPPLGKVEAHRLEYRLKRQPRARKLTTILAIVPEVPRRRRPAAGAP